MKEIIANIIDNYTDIDYTLTIENYKAPTDEEYGFFNAIIKFDEQLDEEKELELIFKIWTAVKEDYEPAEIDIII